MKKVYLIRHAQPVLSGSSALGTGLSDIPLGEQGRAQAHEMAKELGSVTEVFSSPMRRAVQTAQAIGRPVTVLRDLRELQPGEWEGQADLCPVRFLTAMDRAARDARGDFAVVSHGVIISRFLQSLTGTPNRPDYAVVIPLLWENGTFHAVKEHPIQSQTEEMCADQF